MVRHRQLQLGSFENPVLLHPRLSRAGIPVASFSRQQIKTGFWSMVSATGPRFLASIYDAEIPRPVRVEAVTAIKDLYAKLFAVNCKPRPHDIPISDPLDYACEMWWDVFSIGTPPRNASDLSVDQFILLTIRDIASIRSAPCQRAALLGLFFWSLKGYRSEAETIADEFVRDDWGVSDDIKRSAERVREGHHP